MSCPRRCRTNEREGERERWAAKNAERRFCRWSIHSHKHTYTAEEEGDTPHMAVFEAEEAVAIKGDQGGVCGCGGTRARFLKV